MKHLLPLLFCLSISAGDPVDSTRLPHGGTWNGIAGVSNGIPNRGTIYTNLDLTVTMAAINSAIANCPSNQVVLLTNGIFESLGNAHLTLNKNGITLRGNTNANGMPNTILRFSNTYQTQIQNAGWDYDNPGSFTTINVSSGHTRGSSAIVAASTPTGLSVGNLLFITSPKTSTVIEGRDGDYANWFPSTDSHPFTAIHKVLAVSGTTITIWPPLNADYISTNSCKLHYRTFANQIVLSGIENLILTNHASGFFPDNIVEFQGADQCWAKNCKIYGVGNGSNPNAGFWFRTSFNCELRRNQVSRASVYGSSSYGMVTFQCADMLVEDNIFYDLANVWPMIATSASVFSYNYIYYQHYSSAEFLSQIVFFHGAHDHYNLSEGNWIPSHYNDDTASGNYSHSRNNVYFRERLRGWDEYPLSGGKTENLHTMTCNPHHDRLVVAGCVMGTTNKQSRFWGDGNIGNNGENKGNIMNVGSVSSNTLQHIYNYNIVDNGINTSETLGGGDALVNSYIHTSKPTWFGDRPWPWVDPDNVNYSLASTAYTNFPSGFRYQFGSDPPSDGGSPTAPVNRIQLRPGVTVGGKVIFGTIP